MFYIIDLLLRNHFVLWFCTEQRGPKPDSTPLKATLKALREPPGSPYQMYYAVVVAIEVWNYFQIRKQLLR